MQSRFRANVKAAALLMFMAAGALQAQYPRSTPPRVIHKVEPEYTKEALEAKVQGVVIVTILVQEDGTPSDIKVVRGLGSGLDEKAVECVQQWRFTPRVSALGEPTPVKATIEVNFRLPNHMDNRRE